MTITININHHKNLPWCWGWWWEWQKSHKSWWIFQIDANPPATAFSWLFNVSQFIKFHQFSVSFYPLLPLKSNKPHFFIIIGQLSQLIGQHYLAFKYKHHRSKFIRLSFFPKKITFHSKIRSFLPYLRFEVLKCSFSWCQKLFTEILKQLDWVERKQYEKMYWNFCKQYLRFWKVSFDQNFKNFDNYWHLSNFIILFEILINLQASPKLHNGQTLPYVQTYFLTFTLTFNYWEPNKQFKFKI